MNHEMPLKDLCIIGVTEEEREKGKESLLKEIKLPQSWERLGHPSL